MQKLLWAASVYKNTTHLMFLLALPNESLLIISESSKCLVL